MGDTMTWQEIREQNPRKWVLVEAIDAATVGDKRVVHRMAFIGAYDNGHEAMRNYLQMHKEHHSRELYVVHADTEQLEITEKSWLGIRAA
jgi:hypothetical protein